MPPDQYDPERKGRQGSALMLATMLAGSVVFWLVVLALLLLR